jgi:hypothetical protein
LGKTLGELRLDCVAWRVGGLSASLFQKLPHFASQFDRMPMPAFTQRLLARFAHALAQPISRGLTDL